MHVYIYIYTLIINIYIYIYIHIFRGPQILCKSFSGARKFRLHSGAEISVQVCWLSRNMLGQVVTSGVSCEISMIVWRVLVQQQLKHHKMLWLSDGQKGIMSCAKRPCVMTELLCYDLTNMLANGPINNNNNSNNNTNNIIIIKC